MKQQPLIKSFTDAFNGITHFFASDRNGRIHLAASVWVVIAGIYFKVSLNEWMAILLCIAFVISMEMLNHALEKLCDLLHPAPHPIIKIVKDVAAGAVFWSAIISAVIGLLIFVPKIALAV